MTPQSLNGRKSTEIQIRATYERKALIKLAAKLAKMNQSEFIDNCIDRRLKEMGKKFPELVVEGVN